MFFKRHWKTIVGIAVLLVAIVVGAILIRVFGFVDASTGAARTNSYETPTVNVQATNSAKAVEAELFGTPTPGAANVQALPTPTPTIAPTSAPTSDKVVQRLKNGERVSLLFMGYGGSGHEGAYLTDTLLVVSYDPKTKTVTEFNVPRDFWVFMNNGINGAGSWVRINSILASIMDWTDSSQDKLDPRYRWKDDKGKLDAGANLVADTIQKMLGVRIDYWVAMNFDGFRKLIDAMGGIDINVERPFVDYEYPRNDNDKVDAGYMTVKFEAGPQHMDGERAIEFARSRKSKGLEEGDPARSRRQMKVIAAIKDKALKQNLAFDMIKYLDALQGNIRTTLSFDELRGLASYVNTEDGKALADSSKFDNEIMDGNNLLQVVEQPDYRLIPKTGQGKYEQIQQWVQNAFAYAELRREQVRAQVLNASGVTGIAGKWGDYLFDHGFRVAESENAPLLDKSVLYDYTNGAASANLKQLQKYFPSIKVISQPADKKPYDGAPDFMIFLGKDYKAITAAGAGS